VRRWRGVVLTLACLLYAGTLPAADGPAQIEVIELEHRLVDEIRPLLEPLLEPGATLTGSGATLVVRASTANRAEIRAALAAFDHRAQRLRVSVTQTRRGDDAWHGATLAGSVAGDVAAGSPIEATGQARVARTRSRDEGAQVQSVLTLDGASAWVAIADTRPIEHGEAGWTPYGPAMQEGLDWQEARSGFFVTPRLRGHDVQVEISTQQQRFTRDGDGALTSGSVETVVAGRLGEWIPIGGTAETELDARHEIIARTRRQTNAYTGVWLRVDPLP